MAKEKELERLQNARRRHQEDINHVNIWVISVEVDSGAEEAAGVAVTQAQVQGPARYYQKRHQKRPR